MCFEKLSPFPRMLLGAVTGIVLGIALGLAFGLLIVWITSFASGLGGPQIDNNPEGGIPYQLGAFAGMGFGAIVGAILGAVYSNKK